MSTLWVKGARRILVGGPDWAETSGDLWIEDGRIVAVGGDQSPRALRAEGVRPRVLHARGLTVLPGLVQTHVHLGRSLLRGGPEGTRSWPRPTVGSFEAAHDPDSLRAAARLSLHELLRGGTTGVLDLGTTHHHGVVFEAIAESGIRAASGKAMMDEGHNVPRALLETTLDSLRESFDLAERWDGAADGRLRYAFSPRSVASCSEVLWREIGSLVHGKYLVHTQASEPGEGARREENVDGVRPVPFLANLGLLGPKTLIAHGVGANDDEMAALAGSGTRALLCPSVGRRLGADVAEWCRLRDAGVHVTIGADAAPANDRLDMFIEMREAARLARGQAGPGGPSAAEVLRAATEGGAEALGFDELGRLKPGWRADLIAVDLETAHAAPIADPVAALVHSARATDVRHTVVAGDVLMEDAAGLPWDEESIVRDAGEHGARLRERAREHAARQHTGEAKV